MLEGLYAIQWNTLQYANGTASDVPGMLLALASPKKADREMGMDMLRGTLIGRHAVYEAAAAAVPFLLQLFEHPGFEEKAAVLVLLAEIASGADSLDADPALQIGNADPFKIRTWSESAHRQVKYGLPQFIHALNDREAPVRSAAAFLLVRFGKEDRSISAHLVRRFEIEQNAAVLASLIFAIGELNPEKLAGQKNLESMFDGEEMEIVRLAARMIRIRLLRDKTQLETIAALVDELSSEDNLVKEYAALPWAESHLYADIALCLCYAGPMIASAVLPDLMRVLDHVDPQSALTVTYALLFLGFSGSPEGKISSLQRAALATVAESPVLWQVPREAGEVMRMFGLPMYQDEVIALLND